MSRPNEKEGFNKETDTEIYFFTPHFYAFDSFSAYTVEIWDQKFPTAEHAYQWRKFKDADPLLAEQILNATSPSAVKKLSDAHKNDVGRDWNEQKAQIMEVILRAKMLQHEKVRTLLLESGVRTIFENSPDDPYWGIGQDGNGQNMLGKIWMKLRAELK